MASLVQQDGEQVVIGADLKCVLRRQEDVARDRIRPARGVIRIRERAAECMCGEADVPKARVALFGARSCRSTGRCRSLDESSGSSHSPTSAARANSRCQTAVGATAFSLLKRAFSYPSTFAPSGTKLNDTFGLDHAYPLTEYNTSRGSSVSRRAARGAL